jgi:hypothetical protein
VYHFGSRFYFELLEFQQIIGIIFA